MITVVIAGSLFRFGPQLPMAGFDKVNHLVAYGSMMFWWGMLQPGHRWAWALGLAAMGGGLELAQSLTFDRSMEWQDMVANLSGVALACLTLNTPAGRLLSWFDGQLGKRLNAGVS